MEQPQGYTIPDKEHLIYKLKRRLYGLKQAPRQWYLKFDRLIASSGYARLHAAHCCYFKLFEDSYIILLLYVNDMFVAGSSIKEIMNFRA